jgi:hypothetical protein
MLMRMVRSATWSVLGAVLLTPALLHGQDTGGPTVADSSVGYIDSALPVNELRLRFDAAYDLRRPSRAEFFYARPGPRGPGVPLPEQRIDYQDLSAYLEVRATEGLSGFLEVPWRFLNPEVNRNANGLSDVNAGCKWAFVSSPDLTATFQFRTYAPTGEAHRGLGNDHVSLEPALLVYRPLGERLVLESELRFWAPVGGTDFAGNILRYGVGLHYDPCQSDDLRLVPVAELVGWTALNGKESVPHPSGVPTVQGVAGETILNIKLGVRVKCRDTADFYAGYGRALTGDRWYENTFRVEWRLFF